MQTQKLSTDTEHYRQSIERAAEILRGGGTVAIPTETVYGLAASAYDDIAIKKVFDSKGRPQNNPLIVHISSLEMLNRVARDIPDKALLCAEKLWPGPFTMVLPRTGKTAQSVSPGLDTVAVRMPAHTVALDIINAADIPLAAPSANISGSPSPTSAIHVENDLFGKIDAIVYADECEVGVESTVVSFCCEPPRLLRPGAVTAEQLREYIPELVIDKAVLQKPASGERVASPGMLYRHYAPKTESLLVEGTAEKFAELVNSDSSAAAVCFDEEEELIKIPHIAYGSCDNEATLAHGLFSVLRSVDGFKAKKIYIHAPSKTGVGLAVYNRLIRAASFRVVKL